MADLLSLPSTERVAVALRPGTTLDAVIPVLATLLRPVPGIQGLNVGLRVPKVTSETEKDGLDIAEVLVHWETLSAHKTFASDPASIAAWYGALEVFLAGLPKMQDLHFSSPGAPLGTSIEFSKLAALLSQPKVSMVTISGLKAEVKTKDVWKFLGSMYGDALVADVAPVEGEGKAVVVAGDSKATVVKDWEEWIAGRAERVEIVEVEFHNVEL